MLTKKLIYLQLLCLSPFRSVFLAHRTDTMDQSITILMV